MPRTLKKSSVFGEGGYPLAVQLHPGHVRTVTPHEHEFVELVVITGGMGVHVTEAEAFPILAGDVFVIPLGQAHSYQETESLALYNILFDPQRLQMPLADLRGLPGYHALFALEPRFRRQHRFQSRLRLDLEQIAHVTEHLERMRKDLAQQKPGYRFLGLARLMELIGFLSRCYSQTRMPTSRSLLRIGEVITHLETHYADPISLAELARMAHMSDRSLLRAFQETLGHSPIDYLLRCRVRRAAELLRQGDLRMTEVAFAVGFSDSNYFSRQFRRIMGLSPREFRRRGFDGDRYNSSPAPTRRAGTREPREAGR